MTTEQRKKFVDWFKRQDMTTLSSVYDLLGEEFSRRGKSIELDRNFYSSRTSSPSQMAASLEKHFDDVFDKHHGW